MCRHPFLFVDGVLYSMGFDHRSRLGRPTNDVGAKIFGRVITEERILLLACGSDHCITMSKTEVRCVENRGLVVQLFNPPILLCMYVHFLEMKYQSIDSLHFETTALGDVVVIAKI